MTPEDLPRQELHRPRPPGQLHTRPAAMIQASVKIKSAIRQLVRSGVPFSAPGSANLKVAGKTGLLLCHKNAGAGSGKLT